MKYNGLALLLLLVACAAQFAWQWVPVALQPRVWVISQAGLGLFLLGMVANAYRKSFVVGVALLMGLWQAATIACSVAYLIRPWVQVPGRSSCSAAINFPVGAVALALLAVLVYRIVIGMRRAGEV